MTFAELLALVVTELRSRRDNGEFTERQLARLAGVSQPLVSNIFSGRRRLTPDVADQLLAALGLEIEGSPSINSPSPIDPGAS